MVNGVVTAGGGHGWETRVVATLGQPGSGLSVVRRCADIADVLAVASTGQIAGCVLAADLRRLDSDSVQQLTMFGVAVVVVYRAGDQRAATLLERIGVAAALPDDADPETIIAAVERGVGDSADMAAADPVFGEDAGSARPMRRPHKPRPDDPAAVLAAGAAGDAVGDADDRPDDDTADDPRRAARHRSSGGLRRRRNRRSVDADPRRPVGATTARRAEAARLPGNSPPFADRAARRGHVIAVWGPVGAPGRSTVAMGLADRFAAAGDRVLLVDADVYGGVLASAFGLLDESAGLAGACRLAAHGRLDAAELATLCWSVTDRLALLTGIARADRWPELRPSAIPMVLGVARTRADYVIVDCAAVLEADEEITFDTMAPRRNGATIAALCAADLVVAVGSADPPGMERLARGMTELDGVVGTAADTAGPRSAAVAGAAAHVVLNRVRPGAASAGELVEAVRRFCGRDPLALLPEDRSGCDLAWRRGVPVSTVAPKSALVRGLGELAARLGAASAAPRSSPVTTRSNWPTAAR